MSNPLISISILTYNRAHYMERLLGNILPQVKKLAGVVEVCVADNASPDNTQEVVEGFQKQFPGLVTYYRQEKNVGVDKNIIKILEIANGEFIWTFADDDLVVENGVQEVVDFINGIDKKNTGLVVLRSESFVANEKTGKQGTYYNSFDASLPPIFEIDKKEIIAATFPDISFISVLLYNAGLVKKILAEDVAAVEATNGTHHAHVPLFVFMFLKYRHIKALALNTRPIVIAGIAPYKFLVEDKFMLHYQVQKRLINVLLRYPHMDKESAALIMENDKKLRKAFIIDLLVLRMFGHFEYISYANCMRLFFKESPLVDAIVFSAVFSVLFFIPSAVVTSMYKLLLMKRHGKAWRTQWDIILGVASIKGGGTRRRNDLVG